ncbi:heme peroxidase [Gordonia sp. CPCC 205515]|uniref:heme peroxidase n=1 Tax=Gordonia sp. CPCC 205515 TaxID=3140791 RepID=UPI003AF3A258
MSQSSPQDRPGRPARSEGDLGMSRDDEMAALEAAAATDLGDPDLWFVPTGYRNSLALCVIDAVYATGMDAAATGDVVDRYVSYRQANGADAYTDGLHELLRTFTEFGDVPRWAEAIGDQRITPTPADAPLKAAAVQQVSLKFVTRGVATAKDLLDAVAKGRARELRRIWCAAPGQESGVTWTYLLALAGIGGAKTDPLVVDYVSRALGKAVTPEYAAQLMNSLATRAGWDPVAFHLTVWQFESTQR